MVCPLEDLLWAAFKLEGIEVERQRWKDDMKTHYCLDFAVFCPQRNIDVECDGDRWHSNPDHDYGSIRFKLTRQWVRVDTVDRAASFFLRFLPSFVLEGASRLATCELRQRE